MAHSASLRAPLHRDRHLVYRRKKYREPSRVGTRPDVSALAYIIDETWENAQTLTYPPSLPSFRGLHPRKRGALRTGLRTSNALKNRKLVLKEVIKNET